jgi:hypothetical protein
MNTLQYYPNIIIIFFILFTSPACLFSLQIFTGYLPADHLQIKEPISYTRMISFLHEIDQLPFISVKEVGKSAGKRSLFLVRLDHKKSPLPEFIPVNYFWGNVGPKPGTVKVIEIESGDTKTIKTANFMQDMVVKKSVSTPLGYAIEEKNAIYFNSLLRKHAIPFRILKKSETFLAEASRFIKFEEVEDEIYSRYGGRQLVNKDTTLMKVFNTGSLLVILDEISGKRAILLLEPNMLYGIYQSPEYRKLIDDQQILPVWRILKSN